MTIESEQKILKALESGKYRNCYLIYNRKSTDEPESQKNSIRYQRLENTRFAFKEHLPLAQVSMKGFCLDGVISEKHSGFKNGTDLVFGKGGTVQYRIERPKFYQLVQFLNKGYFKGVIFLCWDRASRNKGDNTVIEKLMKQGIDFRFTLASYDKTSSGALHMDIDGMFAQHHSRVTSEKVSLTIRNKREQGICTYKAPVGYLNMGEMEHKPIDLVRAPIIVKMFEMYATGEWSLIDLARWSIEQGFSMPPSRRRKTKEEKFREEEEDILVEIKAICRPPTYINIHKILTNPFYVGKILGNDGLYVPSNSHKGLVSQTLFNRVQEMLKKKKVSAHYIERLDYPLRGMLRCQLCQRVYTPYIKKEILYYGCRCVEGCINPVRSISSKNLFEKIGGIIQHLRFTEEELEDIQTRASTDIALLEMKRHSILEDTERKKKVIREDLAYLRENRLTLLKSGVYTPESLVQEEERLTQKLFALHDTEQISDVAMHETMMDVIKLSELLESVYLYYENANPGEMDKIIRIMFSELTLNGNTLEYKCKDGFEALESRFVPVCDLTIWLSELVTVHHLIIRSIDDLRAIVLSK